VGTEGYCEEGKTYDGSVPALKGISALWENRACPLDCHEVERDIPVRKITLFGECKVFTGERRELSFQTVISPADASYRDEIEYRITTALGIRSNLAQIEAVERGCVRVRCLG